MPDCPKCGTVCASEQGLMKHLKIGHGVQDKQERRDIARAALPGRFNSIQELANAIPENDNDAKAENEATSTGTQGQKAGDPQSPRRRNIQRLAAEEELIRRATVARCRRLAKFPYSIWAAVAHDPTLKLSNIEEEELTAAYLALFESYGWQAAGKLWCWLDLTATHAVLIGLRSDVFKAFMEAGVREQMPNPDEIPPAAPGEEPIAEPPGPHNDWGRGI